MKVQQALRVLRKVYGFHKLAGLGEISAFIARSRGVTVKGTAEMEKLVIKAARHHFNYGLGKRNRGEKVIPHRMFKPTDERFYNSPEWRALRYLVLRNTGARCQCCGAQQSDSVRIHVDHIKPRSQFPHLALAIDNLQVLCEDCNMGKGAWDDTDWRSKTRGETV